MILPGWQVGIHCLMLRIEWGEYATLSATTWPPFSKRWFHVETVTSRHCLDRPWEHSAA